MQLLDVGSEIYSWRLNIRPVVAGALLLVNQTQKLNSERFARFEEIDSLVRYIHEQFAHYGC